MNEAAACDEDDNDGWKMDSGTLYGLSTLAQGSLPITYLSPKEAAADHFHQHHHYQ